MILSCYNLEMEKRQPANIIERYCQKKDIAKNRVSDVVGVSKQTIFNAQNFKISRKVAEKLGDAFGKDAKEKNQFLIQNLLIPRRFAKICQLYPEKVLRYLESLLRRL